MAARPVWTTACPDWEQRIVDRRSLIPFEPLFPGEAAEALTVFKSLKMVDLPPKPNGEYQTFGEACDQWVFDFVAAIFGAYDKRVGERLINNFLLLISKKNMKSTLAAGVMLTALIRNWRHEAELTILAPTITVAHNSFDPAAAMVRVDPVLSVLLHVVDHQRSIRHRDTGAELKVIAADSDVASGSKSGFVLIEELWLFGKRPGAKAMFREATGGLSARPEGFVIKITTHSDEAPAGVMKDDLDYFREVRDGLIVDPKSLGVLYEYPNKMLDEQAYLDPNKFYVTNPNMGRSVSREWLEGELTKELRGDGEGKQIFLAKHLNVEIGLRLARDRWGGADVWEAAAEVELADLETLLERCEVAVVGADGGGRDDLFGLAVIGRERGTRRWLVWCHAWAHEIVLERRKEIAPKLLDFAKAGELTIVTKANPTADHEEAADICETIRDAGLLPKTTAIGVDAAGIADFVDELVNRGFKSDDADGQVIAVQQGYKLNGAIQGTERRLMDGKMVHGGQALLAWCVSNAKAEQKGNATVVTKQASGKAKIDPVIALFNAVVLMSRNPKAAGSSVYRKRGVLLVGR